MIDAIDTFAHHFSVSHSSSVCEKEREREGGDLKRFDTNCSSYIYTVVSI